MLDVYADRAGAVRAARTAVESAYRPRRRRRVTRRSTDHGLVPAGSPDGELSGSYVHPQIGRLDFAVITKHNLYKVLAAHLHR
jgi:hypothetical protein